jgi:hypothetical protein
LAFDSLKDAVLSAPVLISPDNSRPFRIEADSSDFATRAVLSQQSLVDEKWHPVAFLSKSLSSVERNYEIHNKEMLAIIQAMEEWRHFLEGSEHQFEVWTDHKNLQYFMTAKSSIGNKLGGPFSSRGSTLNCITGQGRVWESRMLCPGGPITEPALMTTPT